MQIFKELTDRKNITLLTDIPSTIKYDEDGLPTAYYENGEISCLGCIGCVNPACMYFAEKDISCNDVKGFPYDKSLKVCPVNAISIDKQSSMPIIDLERCISCGICIKRCPVGAIYYDNDVKVNAVLSDKQYIVDINHKTMEFHKMQLDELQNIRKSGSTIVESEELLKNIYKNLTRIGSGFHNPIGRNLLIELGCNCAMRRIGDVYTRMDAVYSSAEGEIGAVEIEFGKDTLEASRDILEDIAVLNNRYEIPKIKNKALVICLKLPNARQGYWQVIKDIDNVQEISINTITIGALMMLLWNGCKLSEAEDRLYIDYDNMSIRQVISSMIGREIRVPDKFLGILEPEK